MKESIGQAFLFNLVIVIISVVLILIVSAMTYSKTYKIKNKIVDIVEKYRGYEGTGAIAEIETYLGSIGYKMNKNATQKCSSNKGQSLTNVSTLYRYCVYEYYASGRGKYYGVTAYIYFEFPLIGDLIEIPVYGETEVFYDETYIGG